MDDIPRVRMDRTQRVEQIERDLHGFLQGQGTPLREHLAQRRSLHELHHQIERVARLQQIVDVDDMRVIELRLHLRLTAKAVHIATEAGGTHARRITAQFLDRHKTGEHFIPGAVDHTKRTLADLILDAVLV